MGGEKARSNLDVATRCCDAFTGIFFACGNQNARTVVEAGKKIIKDSGWKIYDGGFAETQPS